MEKIVLFSLFIIMSMVSFSQCAMCKAVLETDVAGDVGKGINNGILYLMSIPYLLIGTVGYFIYRHYKKTKP